MNGERLTLVTLALAVVVALGMEVAEAVDVETIVDQTMDVAVKTLILQMASPSASLPLMVNLSN